MEEGKVSIRKVLIIVIYISSLISVFGLREVSDGLVFFFTLAVILLSFINEFKNFLSIPRKLLNVFAILGTLTFLLQVSFENLIKPFANILLILLSVKFLEEKRVRDIYQILALNLFSVSVITAVNVDITFVALLITEVLLSILSAVLLLFYRYGKDLKLEILKKVLAFSILFSVLILFSSVFFFILLPRVNKPLFDIFARKDTGLVSGISENVEIGKVGEIQLDKRIVLRVFGIKFLKEPYWRVSVFDTYKNGKWIKTLRIKQPLRKNLKGKRYTAILEPTYDTYLPLLNYPEGIERIEGFKGNVYRFKGDYYELSKPATKPLKIYAYYTNVPLSDYPFPVYLQVPKDIPESIKKLARKLSRGTKNSMEKVQRVIRYFKENDYKYTLKLEHYEGDPLEDFLFRKKKGNCEYYATATAILLRLMGVPARVISGFHGAIKNDYGNYYVVINGMAHVWVEAYVNGIWITVDTTPPYVPESVKNVSKLSLIYDAILTFWYENVVGFSTEKQREIAKFGVKLFQEAKTYVERNLKKLAVLFLILLFTCGAIILYLREVRKTPENLYRKLLRKLKKYGIQEKSPEKILEKFRGNPKYKYVKFIIHTYERWKYTPFKDKEELKEAYRVLKEI